jgi:hypothetical protein
MSEQHDDHIWLVVHRECWAIRVIERRHGSMVFHLWRGYGPFLEFQSIEFITTDWPAYCEMASQMLQEVWECFRLKSSRSPI